MYLIIVQSGKAPSKIHKDYKEAQNEAYRLAELEMKTVRIVELREEIIPTVVLKSNIFNRV